MLSRTFLPTRLALGFLAICGARADESGYVRINLLRSWQNHMTAPARLNGHNAKLIVDTGAFCSCLDPASVRSFGIRLKNGMTVTLNGQPHSTAQLDSIGIGPVEIRNVRIALVSISEYNKWRDSGESRADGILGLDVLLMGRAVLDCQHLRLFWKAVPNAPDVMASTLRAAGWTPVKLELKGNHYFANGTVNETPARFLIDTGAFATIVDRGFAARAGVAENGQRLRTAGVHNEDERSHVARPTTFAIGGFSLKDFPVAISGLHTPGFLDKSVSGVIGGDVLGRNLGVIDCEQHVLYLKSSGAR